MMIKRRFVFLFLLTGSSLACGAGAPADAPAASQGGPAEAVAPAPAAAAQAAGGDERPILTEPLLERWVEAAGHVEAAKAADPELDEIAAMRGDISIAENAQTWDRTPALRAAVERAGLTSREYLAIGAEIVGAFLAEATIGEEALKQEPEVTQRNVAFVREHQARIRRAMEDMRRGE